MVALLFFLLRLLVSPFRPISRLEAENAALRRQLIVLQRQVRGRVQFTNSDRLFFLRLYRWFPSIVKAMTIIRPETLVRWHRAGFRRYWRWKSWNLGGRPPIDADLRALIRRMSIENMLWGAPRIHGELLKLGFAVAQSTVAKYRPAQTAARLVSAGGQCTDDNDLAVATLFAMVDLDFINERTNDFDKLRACRLIIQHLLQSGDLSPIEIRKVRMDRDLHVALLGFQVGVDLAFASLQAP